MKGEWVLFRLSPRPGEKGQPWMLKKVTDEYADPDHGDALVEDGVTSVTTGRTMAEIAAGEDVWRSNRGGQKGGRAKKKSSKAPPAFQEPQLATLVDEVPAGDSWIHEYKYDGYRLLLARRRRRRDRVDAQWQGLERQVQGAGEGRGEASRRVPHRRRGGCAR